MSDERERGEVRPADYIKRAKKIDGLEFPVDVTDWHNAQVIEATTAYGRQILPRRGAEVNELDLIWQGVGAKGIGTYWFGSSALSDVRVIVDAEGKVVPPPIDDEMRKAINAALWETLGMANVQPLVIRQAERRVLAALGGADHD